MIITIVNQYIHYVHIITLVTSYTVIGTHRPLYTIYLLL